MKFQEIPIHVILYIYTQRRLIATALSSTTESGRAQQASPVDEG